MHLVLRLLASAVNLLDKALKDRDCVIALMGLGGCTWELWLAKQSFPFTFRARPADHIAGSFGADWPTHFFYLCVSCLQLPLFTFGLHFSLVWSNYLPPLHPIWRTIISIFFLLAKILKFLLACKNFVFPPILISYPYTFASKMVIIASHPIVLLVHLTALALITCRFFSFYQSALIVPCQPLIYDL